MKKKEVYGYWKDIWIKSNIIEEILLKTTGLSKNQLFLINDIWDKYIEEIKIKFNDFKEWKPIEYINTKADFFSIEFYVDERVLIPRNDTEILVDEAIKHILSLKTKSITLFDIWSWSWCVWISIAQNINISNTYLLDISEKALEVSDINIKNFNLENKIKTINSNLLDKVLDNINEFKLSEEIIITANLPYIKNNDFENMDKEVICFEPSLALYWWEKDGFELYTKLIQQIILVSKILKKEITVFIEIWFDQTNVAEKYLNKFWFKYYFYKDTWNINRCLKIIIK